MRTTRYLFSKLAGCQNMLSKSPVLPVFFVLTLIIGCALPFSGPKTPEEQVAVVTTDKGTFVIEFYNDSAPIAVENFIKLINQKFYDGLTFHRRIDEFVVQGGCPNGDGTGGPGWKIIDEYTNPNQRPHLRGTVAMARTQEPNSSGSQFYICFKPLPYLDGDYTTFGGVVQGMDVVDRLEIGDVMAKIRLEAKSKYVKATPAE